MSDHEFTSRFVAIKCVFSAVVHSIGLSHIADQMGLRTRKSGV